MHLLAFILVMLVLIDHAMRYKSESLIYYKNNHRFTVVVAVLDFHSHISDLIELSKHSEHEFLFVGVNGVLDKDYDEKVHIIETMCAGEEGVRTPVLSKAYHEGYKETDAEFLLFMDAAFFINNPKILDHMANNLVEHQVYTVKEMYPYRPANEGYKLFFDIFREMNVSSDTVNYQFFAIKRTTYELAGCHERIYEDTSAFENDLMNKNVNLMHIRHQASVEKVEQNPGFKEFLSRWVDSFKNRRRNFGTGRMLLLLLALHFFYFAIVYDFSWVNLSLLVAVHVGIWFVFSSSMRQHILQYVLIPFYMLFFDLMLVYGALRRLLHTIVLKRQGQ